MKSDNSHFLFNVIDQLIGFQNFLEASWANTFQQLNIGRIMFCVFQKLS